MFGKSFEFCEARSAHNNSIEHAAHPQVRDRARLPLGLALRRHCIGSQRQHDRGGQVFLFSPSTLGSLERSVPSGIGFPTFRHASCGPGPGAPIQVRFLAADLARVAHCPPVPLKAQVARTASGHRLNFVVVCSVHCRPVATTHVPSSQQLHALPFAQAEEELRTCSARRAHLSHALLWGRAMPWHALCLPAPSRAQVARMG